MRHSVVSVNGELLVRFWNPTKCKTKFNLPKGKLGPFWLFLALVSLFAVSTRGNSTTCTSWVDVTYGHDGNPGTLTLPTKTIQKAIELWRESGQSCSLILQLSPGNYLEKGWEATKMELSIMKCEECPPFEYNQESVTVSSEKTMFVISSNITIKNIDFRSAGIVSRKFFVALSSNVRLIQISASNFISKATLFSSSYGSLSVHHSRFEDNIFMPSRSEDTTILSSYISNALEIDHVVCQRNTILRQSYIATVGGACIIAVSDFSMKNSIIRYNEVKTNPTEYSDRGHIRGAVSLRLMDDLPHLVTISDSIFEFNSLPLYYENSHWWSYGGALSISSPYVTSINLVNLTFNGNSAFYGGAVAVRTVLSSKTTNRMSNCSFFNNTGLAGSALYVDYPASTWKITDSVFSSNVILWKAMNTPSEVERTGTLYLVLNGHSFLSDCLFEANRIENYGNRVDFIPIDGLVLYLKTGAEIFGCKFKNHDTTFDVPLIIFNWPGTFFGITIDSNTFENNRGLVMSMLPGDQAILAEATAISSVSTTTFQNTSNFFYQFERFQLSGNVFRISPTLRYSPITIATPLKVLLSNNTFHEILSDSLLPPIDKRVDLITVAQYPKSCTFTNQDVPFMRHFRGISVIKIPEFALQSSSWRLPIQLAEVGSVNFNGAKFFNMSTTAIHLVNSASSRLTETTFDSISSADSSAALKVASATVVITKSTFSNCVGLIGGVIKTDSYLRVRDSVFLSNKAISLAGAIWTSALLKIENSNFTSNSAPQAGAIFSASGLVTVSGSVFAKNYAEKSGGAFWVLERLRMDSSTLIENWALAYAGAISMGSDATLFVLNTSFIKNMAGTPWKEKNEVSHFPTPIPSSTESMREIAMSGGSGGSIWMPMGKRLFVQRCSFSHEQANSGPSIYLQGIPRDLSITDSTFSRPSRLTDLGGSITIHPAPASYCESERDMNFQKKIQNCTFTATSVQLGGALHLQPCEPEQGSYIPTIHMSECTFNECVDRSSLIYIQGPLGTYLNWTRSTIDCQVDLLDFEFTPTNSTSILALNENFPPGCIDCTIPPESDRLLSNIASVATLNTTQFWHVSSQLIPISLTGIYLGGYWKRVSSAITLTTSHPGIFGIFAMVYLEDISLPKSLRVSLNASSAFYHQSIYVGSSLERETEFNAKQVPLFESGYSIFIHVAPRALARWYPLVPDLTIDVTLTGCDVGHGIRPHPVLANTFICAPCPVGSYNIAPSANCYLCNDPKSPVTKVSCFGSTITSEQGHFVSTSRNRIWTYDCNYKYCDGTSNDTQCSDNRQGYLCADCAPDMKESLMFSLCGSCPHSQGDTFVSHSFVIVSVGLLVLFAFGTHWAINKNLPLTLTGLFSAQQLLLYPRQYVSTVLPHGLPAFLVHWACIAPSSAMTRATIFAPLISALLPIFCAAIVAVFVLVIVVAKKVACKKCEADSDHSITEQSETSKSNQLVEFLELTTKEEASTPFQQILLSAWVFGLLTLAPLLQTIIEFSSCEETLNGDIWRVAPSIHCSDIRFKQRRLLFMMIGIPWIIFYIFSTGVLLTIGKLGSLGLVFQYRTFFKSKNLAVVCLASLIISNLLVGMVTSLSYWKDNIAPIIVPFAIMIPVANFVFLQPMTKSFFDNFLMIVSFITASIALIPWSRFSMAHPNTSPVNDALQLYCTLGLIVFCAVPLFLSENLINRLGK